MINSARPCYQFGSALLAGQALRGGSTADLLTDFGTGPALCRGGPWSYSTIAQDRKRRSTGSLEAHRMNKASGHSVIVLES